MDDEDDVTALAKLMGEPVKKAPKPRGRPKREKVIKKAVPKPRLDPEVRQMREVRSPVKGFSENGLKIGRPVRGEGTTVIGVRLAQSMRDLLESAAKETGEPASVLLRAGGMHLASLILSKKWGSEEEVRAFVIKHGGASW